MKFKVTMKCPDSLDTAIEEACTDEIGGPDISEEHDIAFDELFRKTNRLCEKWFRYGEYITVEIDTEEGTCVVCT